MDPSPPEGTPEVPSEPAERVQPGACLGAALLALGLIAGALGLASWVSLQASARVHPPERWQLPLLVGAVGCLLGLPLLGARPARLTRSTREYSATGFGVLGLLILFGACGGYFSVQAGPSSKHGHARQRADQPWTLRARPPFLSRLEGVEVVSAEVSATAAAPDAPGRQVAARLVRDAADRPQLELTATLAEPDLLRGVETAVAARVRLSLPLDETTLQAAEQHLRDFRRGRGAQPHPLAEAAAVDLAQAQRDLAAGAQRGTLSWIALQKVYFEFAGAGRTALRRQLGPVAIAALVAAVLLALWWRYSPPRAPIGGAPTRPE